MTNNGQTLILQSFSKISLDIHGRTKDNDKRQRQILYYLQNPKYPYLKTDSHKTYDIHN